MSIFPQGNPGVVPLDPTTAVGSFRLLFGDTQSIPYDPPVEGFGDYGYFSDAEIGLLIQQGGNSDNRAIGFGYLRLAGAAAVQAKSVKDFDLTVDLTKRAGELSKIAQLWFDRADAIDDAGGEGDFFDVVGFDEDEELLPEGMVPTYGRYSVRGTTGYRPATPVLVERPSAVDGGVVGG